MRSGIVIRSEKDDIWERIAPSEVYKLDDKLQEAIQYGTYHKRIEGITTMEDCKNLEFELMENDNVYLNRVLGKLWTELEAKQNEIVDAGIQKTGELQSDIVAEFRSKTDELFHDVDGQCAGDIEKMVAAYVQEKIEEEMLDAEIVDVVLSGSRCRGLEKKGSDLDVVVEYKGSIREDDFFNMLHEDDYEISGIKVDINPITEVKTGKLETYLPGVKEYLRKKEMEKNERKSVREKIREKKDKARGETCKLKGKKRNAVR